MKHIIPLGLLLALFVTMLAGMNMTAFAEDETTLDLESDAAYPDTYDITQQYMKTTGSDTTYTNLVKMEWSGTGVAVRVSTNKKWNPVKLCWEANGEDTSAVETSGATTITLRNYSARSFQVSVEFVLNDDLSDEMKATYNESGNTFTFVDGKSVLDAVEYDDDGVALEKYFTDSTRTTIKESALPTVTLTQSLGLNQEEFDGMNTDCGKYGAWQVTLTAID